MKAKEIEIIIDKLLGPEGKENNELVRIGLKGLDPVTKAHLIQMLVEKGHPREKLLTNYLPILGIQPSSYVLEGLKRVNQLSSDWKDYIIDRDLNLKTILGLVEFPNTLLELVFPLIKNLQVGGYKLIKIISLINEISIREQSKPESIINDEELRRLIENKNISRPEKISRIIKKLYQRRMPIISEKANTLENRLKELNLSSCLKVIPPENFETSEWEIRLKFRDNKILKELIQDLQKISHPKRFDKIFGS